MTLTTLPAVGQAVTVRFCSTHRLGLTFDQLLVDIGELKARQAPTMLVVEIRIWCYLRIWAILRRSKAKMSDDNSVIKEGFAIDQYKLCQSKMEQAIEHLLRIELYALVSLGAIYTWLFTIDIVQKPYIVVGFWLPVVVSIIVLLRLRLQREYMRKLQSYMIQIEENFIVFGSFRGWEAHNFSDPRHGNLIAKYRFVFDWSIVLGTLIIALFFSVGLDLLQYLDSV